MSKSGEGYAAFLEAESKSVAKDLFIMTQFKTAEGQAKQKIAKLEEYVREINKDNARLDAEMNFIQRESSKALKELQKEIQTLVGKLNERQNELQEAAAKRKADEAELKIQFNRQVEKLKAYQREALARAESDYCLLYTSPSPRDS